MMMGVIVGLIVGVAAVVGAVMYFSHAATPFTNLQKMTPDAGQQASSPTQVLSPGISIQDANSNGPVAAPPPPNSASVPVAAPAAAPTTAAGQPPRPATSPQPAKAQQPGAKSGKDSQRFDFYKILPGQVDAVTADGNAPAVTQHNDGGALKRPYLQLGAFQNQDDADNLKAKLALIGIEATIQSISVPGKGLVHRVRVGPFQHQDDVDRVRAQLRQNGIDSAPRAAN